MKNRYIIPIIFFFIISCSNIIKYEKDNTWQKFIAHQNELKNYIPKTINVYQEVNRYKEKKYLSLTFVYNESSYYFVDGTINNKNLDKTSPDVLNTLELLNNNKNRKSFFFDKNINSKIYKTKKNKIINKNQCKAYRFKNEILENKKRSIEKGLCWIDVDSGRLISLDYKVKFSAFATLFIPTKMKIKYEYFYDNAEIVKSINQIYFKLYFPFIGYESNVKFINSNYISIPIN